MIDWTRVEELRSEIGDDGFSEVVELFLDEVEGVVMRLGSKAAGDSYEGDLHFLKGCAWNLGFAAFASICQAGERHVAAGNDHLVNVAEIVACYGQSKAAFMTRAAEMGISPPGESSAA